MLVSVMYGAAAGSVTQQFLCLQDLMVSGSSAHSFTTLKVWPEFDPYEQ